MYIAPTSGGQVRGISRIVRSDGRYAQLQIVYVPALAHKRRAAITRRWSAGFIQFRAPSRASPTRRSQVVRRRSDSLAVASIASGDAYRRLSIDCPYRVARYTISHYALALSFEFYKSPAQRSPRRLSLFWPSFTASRFTTAASSVSDERAAAPQPSHSHSQRDAINSISN